MENKAGIYIGDALLQNPEYPITQLVFKNINLGTDGLYRLMEGVNSNKHIRRLHIGILVTYYIIRHCN